jgi:hypothetical protein
MAGVQVLPILHLILSAASAMEPKAKTVATATKIDNTLILFIFSLHDDGVSGSDPVKMSQNTKLRSPHLLSGLQFLFLFRAS